MRESGLRNAASVFSSKMNTICEGASPMYIGYVTSTKAAGVQNTASGVAVKPRSGAKGVESVASWMTMRSF